MKLIHDPDNYATVTVSKMMKPWEEEWVYAEGYEIERRDDCSKVLGAILRDDEPEFRADAKARCHLAAAAPDLYRVLERNRWWHGECVECGGQHKCVADCALNAALRKARGEP